ncbi:MAG: type II CRISPR-associated endonuclease Cas1 [Candidatus Zixiibacteriota bacterium]
MRDRVIDISDEGAGLSVRNEQLVIRRGEVELTVPLEDLAALVVSHPAVHYTQAVLTSLCRHGGAMVVCDQKRLPIGMVMPLVGHSTQTERFAAQREASVPLQKQLWKQVVRAKVVAQARLLKRLCEHDHGLAQLARSIRSGDAGNIEGQASRRYWPAIFGPSFRRDPMAEDHNKLLNYGYAVLRAMVTRAICASGLHPSLGIHHHNRYDTFCLADDLMEPYRPLVDEIVVQLVRERGATVPLDKDCKAALIGGLASRRFEADKEKRTLFDLLTGVTASLAGVYTGERSRLYLPIL